jgi:hypothetical protein
MINEIATTSSNNIAITSTSSIILNCLQAIKDGETEVGVWHADFSTVSSAVEHMKNEGWGNTRFVPTPDLSTSRQGWLITLGETTTIHLKGHRYRPVVVQDVKKLIAMATLWSGPRTESTATQI